MKWNKKATAPDGLRHGGDPDPGGLLRRHGLGRRLGRSDGYKIAFVQGVAGDEFYISMQCGIEAEAEAQGATVTTQGPEKFDPTLQKPIVDAVVASQPDALLIAPTDVSAMQAPIAAAEAAGIKVVLVDTTLEDPSGAVSQISSSDNEGGGAAAFEAIQKANPNGGKVLVVSTDPGVSTTDARPRASRTPSRRTASSNRWGCSTRTTSPPPPPRS